MSLHPYACAPGRRGVVVTFQDTNGAHGPIQGIINGLEDSVALLGPTGVIECVNQAWSSLAPPSLDQPGSEQGWLGLSLLDILRTWGNEARAAAEGIEKALQGQEAVLGWDYSRPLPGGQTRRYRMSSSRVQAGPFELMVVQREITDSTDSS